jgi:tryptophanyl-tRNA synthetase
LATIPTTAKKKRVLSGMRPTGKLHIGHYFGALENWVRLQNELSDQGPAYDCFYFIADWHALTSDYADTSAVAQNTIEIVTDYLAAGLDPQKSVIFQQSLVPEHAELHLLLGMVTPLGWLERVPTYKEQIENVTSKDLHTYGFLGYPCLQTADIVMYSQPGTPLFVPVGEDQVSHVELSREIVRRFDFFYGFEVRDDLFAPANSEDCVLVLKKLGVAKPPCEAVEASVEGLQARTAVKSAMRNSVIGIGIENFLKEAQKYGKYFEFNEILTEPQVQLTKTPRIPGLDGRKMSKSYGNAITLSESDADIRAKTKVMVTDPARKRRSDPGNPDVCPVYDWHKLFSTPERDPGRLDWVRQGCTTAGIGCIECKAAMAENLIKWIAPIRERRVKWENDRKGVLEIIDNGSDRARSVAQGTIERVREAVFGWKKKRAGIKAVAVAAHDTHD